MNHILQDNTAEWDARVRSEQQRERTTARLRHIGVSSGLLLLLVALALGFTLRPKQRPAVAAPAPVKKAVLAPLPEPAELGRQAQDLAVGLARVWRNGKSVEASEAARSYTADYERVVGCDLRWIAGREGPGVWEGTVSLVRALQEITPYVGRAREGQAVVVTAVICSPEPEAPKPVRHATPD